MSLRMERCTECGAPLTAGVCGNCAPTGRPVDKGERRLEAGAAAHEKEQWDLQRVNRKVHQRARRAT
ncbi:MAG TPA: hypothetical protein VFV20_03055 [Candidatus Limnocylindria bacterium]|nr:hypothetical protein [Candidatus Limnocylindria bacterium]